ncbi:hypothetical protein [Sphaerochaeta sp. PS]|uniref:hypothetical protein n=1 Tax=Sphaerochaeta sp. PS TaxID=3076336 RepID=UPI0028A4B58C|nr:hypothetical protein [Sphaerochaeta sp. PS]MDT4762145.1 hypothetical protein [Sphaerochaeta sp. PS]
MYKEVPLSEYEHEGTGRNGEAFSLSSYKGKVLLIVNSATHCGFNCQYSELEAMYEQYKAKGFEILDFPSSQ